MHTIEPITLNALLSRAWIAPSLLTFLYMILNVADLQREINTLMGSVCKLLVIQLSQEPLLNLFRLFQYFVEIARLSRFMRMPYYLLRPPLPLPQMLPM